MLHTRHGVELSYAPEVIRYLTTHQADNIDAALKEVYLIIEQSILNQADNKNRPNQLFLQLNESGHILRCDWLITSAARQHTS